MQKQSDLKYVKGQIEQRLKNVNDITFTIEISNIRQNSIIHDKTPDPTKVAKSTFHICTSN